MIISWAARTAAKAERAMGRRLGSQVGEQGEGKPGESEALVNEYLVCIRTHLFVRYCTAILVH